MTAEKEAKKTASNGDEEKKKDEKDKKGKAKDAPKEEELVRYRSVSNVDLSV